MFHAMDSANVSMLFKQISAKQKIVTENRAESTSSAAGDASTARILSQMEERSSRGSMERGC